MILLDYKDKRPIYEQIISKLQELILKGILEKDTPLPSVRSLATELSINPNTIQRAYAELERSGWIYSLQGKGSFVAGGKAAVNDRITEWFNKLEDMIDEADLLGIQEKDILEAVQKHRTKQAGTDKGGQG